MYLNWDASSKSSHGLPRVFLIRGSPAPGVDLAQYVRRMKHPDASANDKIWFIEGDGQPWVLIDIDKKPVPANLDPIRDPKAAIDYLVENCLPPGLRDVTFVWQWSSSTGMAGQGLVSAHLWLWLDRPMMEAELKAWFHSNEWIATHDSHIDPTLFQVVQPHFTATPVFDGVADPVSCRTGIRKGAIDVASLPVPPPAIVPQRRTSASKPATRLTSAPSPVPLDYDIVSSTHASKPATRPSSAPSPVPLDYDIVSSTHGFEKKLALIGDGIVDGVQRQGFHRVLTAAAASYASEHGTSFDRGVLKDKLRNAIRCAPKRPGREGEIERYASAEYLDDIIASAIERFGESATIVWLQAV
jgi:hypothetical protein